MEVKKFVYEGKEYTRLEDLPKEVRKFFEDEDKDGVPDLFAKTRFGLDLKKSGPLSDEELRQSRTDSDNDGIPDLLTGRKTTITIEKREMRTPYWLILITLFIISLLLLYRYF